MHDFNELLLTIITLLTGIIGYFVKQLFDRTERASSDLAEIKPTMKILEAIGADVANIRPKVKLLDRISANVADMRPKVKFLSELLVTVPTDPQ